MITLQEQSEKLEQLGKKYKGVQADKYRNSIFLSYILLPGAKSKGNMMEEFFCWFLNNNGIKTEWVRTNANYDFLINGKEKVELKVASIGYKNIVSFNQLHFGKDREVSKFLLAIIKPNDEIDFFIIPKESFLEGHILIQRQHSKDEKECARLSLPYGKMCETLKKYQVNVEELKEMLSN